LTTPVAKGFVLDDVGVVVVVVVVVAGAVIEGEGLVLPPLFVLLVLVLRGDEAEARRGFLASANVGVDGAAADEEEEDEDKERLALRQPPPTGTLRRTPPLVQ
jgi:hypothetical protein